MPMSYEEAAREYFQNLPPDRPADAPWQATQRKITRQAFELIRAQRPEIHLFDDLLVQYPLPDSDRPGQVVPDTFVVIHTQPLDAPERYDLPQQPAGLLCAIEYVTADSVRKDYAGNLRKYENELKVPYVLRYVPSAKEITLYRHDGEKYVGNEPNEYGRAAIPELELEIGLHEDWMRFGFRGELLPLSDELERELSEEHQANLAVERDIARTLAGLQRLQRGG